MEIILLQNYYSHATKFPHTHVLFAALIKS